LPELPEVETVRLGLAPVLTGARVTNIDVYDQRSLKRHAAGVQDFLSTLTGRRILGVVRRGKFIWMPLEPASGELTETGELTPGAKPLALLGHLGMSGQMLLRTPGFEPDKLTRVVIHVTEANGEATEFRFIDQRLFGGLQLDVLVPTIDGKSGGYSAGIGDGQWWQNLIPQSASHISRDPLDAHFDQAAVLKKLANKNTGIKRALLDQGLVSGIGNIYADESLWRAKLHYDQQASSVSGPKAKELLQHVREILADAVKVGGTSFDEQYKNVNGESGYFEISLNAYGRTGTPCSRCGTPIKREQWANRGSHFCPKCQKKRG